MVDVSPVERVDLVCLPPFFPIILLASGSTGLAGVDLANGQTPCPGGDV